MASITEPGEKSMTTNDKQTTEKEGLGPDSKPPTDGKDTHNSEMAAKPKGLPPIDLGELNSLLRNPNMPQKKILHEVADKVIQSRSDRSMNKDGSEVITGMKGLFDCILEVSLKHTESDEEEEDEDDVPLNREFSCVYCQKVFTSSMAMKTHILVLHSNQDSSVLNLRHLMSGEGQRITPAHRTKSRDSCGDGKETKSRHPSRGEKTSTKIRDENAPVSRSLLSRSQSRGSTKSEGKSLSEPVSPDGAEMKVKSSSPINLKGDIHSEKTDSVVTDNPTSPSDQLSRDVSRISPSSQRVEEEKSEQTSSMSTDRKDNPNSSNVSSVQSSEETKDGARKRQKEDEEETSTPSPVKRGRPSRSSQGAVQEDSKSNSRRSSRRH